MIECFCSEIYIIINIMSKVDDEFYDRADQHINLSNEQLKETEQGGSKCFNALRCFKI